MNKQQVYENSEIARKHLQTYHLLIPDDNVLFDCYCLPSLRWKAFYAQVYMVNGIWRANCAYTHYADHLGAESYSVHFTDIEKAEHPAKTTDIICKTIFPDADIINTLSEYANYVTSIERFENKGAVIDGIAAGIRLFQNGDIIHDILLIDPEKPEPLLDAICSFSDMI